ncbi:PDZ domain-containing protein [Flavobacterium sp. SUN052]|uniref:retropepsin-like aspartic protease n=1 Tax=Flavobacterium sp. SUN052 TaxID=3002441 RepID=UPI00237D3593|nr:PDZ domain-containing protein [Flavobacterium sp. SUN052]MEC4005684.1 PDZ domain-containing protein [Flavobacterium sp. SUN052]
MKFKIVFFCFLFSFQFILAQDGFHFDTNKTKTTIAFEFVNNLIIIPIEVNGVKLNFLLDTGVEDSILFSVDDTDGVIFSNIEKIRIRGFGSNDAFDAYKSLHNKLSIKNYTDLDHTIFLVLDQNINISSQIGVPVNGIIGHNFFKNDLVKINYTTKRITVFKNTEKEIKKINKSFQMFPLEMIYGKPYISTKTFFENSDALMESKLLIDIGNNDALWLFSEKNKEIVIPNSTIEDFLGRGFSGDVYGKRGRIKNFKIGNFNFKNPLVAFPNDTATVEADKIVGRIGSIGSEIMRRFTTVYNYQANEIYLKQNPDYNDSFNFNMSGLDIQHQGLQWISEGFEENPAISNNLFDGNGNKVINNLKYKFELKPIYIIANVRKDSPAEKAGILKNDIIVKIDGRNGYNFTLQQINDLLKSEEGKTIKLIIDRKGKIINLVFQLKNLL